MLALRSVIDKDEKVVIVEHLCASLVPPAHREIILGAFRERTNKDHAGSAVDVVNVDITRSPRRRGLGLSLRGGAEFDMALCVSAVEASSPAAEAGLLCGDTVTAIEGQSTAGMTHATAVALVSAAGQRVRLEIERRTGTTVGPGNLSVPLDDDEAGAAAAAAVTAAAEAAIAASAGVGEPSSAHWSDSEEEV